jgi:hypothetical protein
LRDEWEMAENRTVVGDREFLEVLDPRLWSEVESSARNGNAGKRERGDPISNDE